MPPLTYSPDMLAALAMFGFVSSITPGPNNMMLMASGANFGMRRTVPHFLGVVLGFCFLILCIGLGLGGLFNAYPWLQKVLQVVGAAYMLWLAWKLATAKGLGGKPGAAAPMTFLQAVAFQWVNPKAWAMGLAAITTYLPHGSTWSDLLLVALVFAVVNAPCVAIWAGFGRGLRRFLDRPRVLQAFNLVMATLLVLSLYPLVLEYLR